jgi:hypothetical protein
LMVVWVRVRRKCCIVSDGGTMAGNVIIIYCEK